VAIDPKTLDERHRGTLTELLGIRFVEASLDRVVAELTIRDDLRTIGFAAGREGVVRAEAIPLHRGRSTMVWQTRVTDANGRLLSLTIQTQMVLTR
jgi:acyl-coenzyme A thioesterase PaaI-like protein